MRNAIRNSAILSCAAAIAVLAVPGCSHDSAPSTGPEASERGNLGLNLILDSEQQLDEVTYTITGSYTLAGGRDPDGAGPLLPGQAVAVNETGTIPVEAELAEVSAYVYGLVASSTPYTIELEAVTADGLTECHGTAEFTVVAGQTVGVTVPFQCSLTDDDRGSIDVDVDMNECPVIEWMSLAPVVNEEGFTSLLRAEATDRNGEPLTFTWTTDRGTLTNAATPNAEFECACPVGTAVNQECENHITLTVNDANADGLGCFVSQTATAICRTRSVCGNGIVEAGEQCDVNPPVAGDACNDQCLNIVCGDNRVDDTEQCDFGADVPGVCVNCQAVAAVCGDGYVQTAAGEECDPAAPGTQPNTCDATCHRIPIVCGNSLVQPGEDCDPPGSPVTGPNGEAGVCSATCTTDFPTACEICSDDTLAGFCATEPAARDTLLAGEPAAVQAAANALMTCMETTECYMEGTFQHCFCGPSTDGYGESCFGSAVNANTLPGDCTSQYIALYNAMLAAGEVTNPMSATEIGYAFLDASLPLGVIGRVWFCRDYYCATTCGWN